MGLWAEEESVLVDLKNINKDALHTIEAPIDATTGLPGGPSGGPPGGQLGALPVGPPGGSHW